MTKSPLLTRLVPCTLGPSIFELNMTAARVCRFFAENQDIFDNTGGQSVAVHVSRDSKVHGALIKFHITQFREENLTWGEK